MRTHLYCTVLAGVLLLASTGAQAKETPSSPYILKDGRVSVLVRQTHSYRLPDQADSFGPKNRMEISLGESDTVSASLKVVRPYNTPYANKNSSRGHFLALSVVMHF